MRKLLTILLLSVFLISLVSAYDFDNVKSYNSDTKTATIKNAFGLGGKIADIQLLTPQENIVELNRDCEIFDVVTKTGYNCKIAEIEINNFNDYSNALKKMDFFNVYDLSELQKEFTYKQKVLIGQKEVNDYEVVCKITIDKNTHRDCSNVKVGSHLEDNYIWVDVSSKDLKKGIITIGVFTDVQAKDYVEWIPTLFGVRINEWATYKAEVEDAVGFSANADSPQTAKLGMKFTSKINGQFRQITKYSGVTATKGYLLNGSRSILETATFYGDDANFTYTIEAGKNYYVVVDKEGASYTNWIDTSGIVFPIVKTNINYTAAWDGSSDSTANYFELISVTTAEELAAPTLSVNTTLISPVNVFNTTSKYLNFSANATSINGNLTNMTLRIWNFDNTTYLSDTKTLSNTNLTQQNWTSINIVDDGRYYWNVLSCAKNLSSSLCAFNPINRTLTIDTIPPFVNITFPESKTYYNDYVFENNKTIQVNWTVLDTSLSACWLYNGTANNTVACIDNSSYQNITYGSHNFCFYANDTSGNQNQSCSSPTFSYNLLENSKTYNSTIYETDKVELKVNVSSGSTLTAAALVWNQTSYPTQLTSTGGSYIFNRSIDVPLVSSNTNISSYWIFSNSSSNINSSFLNQTIKPISFSLCNATNTIPYLNFTFTDEGTLLDINGSIPTSTFTYYFGDGTISKSYTYINNTDNENYLFCFTPSSKTLYVEPIIQYKSGTDYPQRIYEPAALTLTNSSTEKVLYLLSTSDGLYVTFQVINLAQQTLSGVEVTVTRIIGGTTYTIGTGTTDAAGSVTFWLNPDFEHTATFVKSEYDTYIFVVTPTQTSYTITLGGGTTTTAIDCRIGVSYQIKPQSDYLDNHTLYNFNFTITSTNSSLSEYGFTLYYSNGTSIGIESGSTSAGGILSLNNVNPYNETGIYMSYYYTITSCDSINGTRTWIIQTTEGRNFSIYNFFSDLVLYIDAGMFGIDDFGKALLSFIIIVMVIGGVGYRYGLRSEAAVAGMLFGIVFLLDYVNFLPSISLAGGIIPKEHFIVIITAVVLIVTIFREEIK